MATGRWSLFCCVLTSFPVWPLFSGSHSHFSIFFRFFFLFPSTIPPVWVIPAPIFFVVYNRSGLFSVTLHVCWLRWYIGVVFSCTGFILLCSTLLWSLWLFRLTYLYLFLPNVANLGNIGTKTFQLLKIRGAVSWFAFIPRCLSPYLHFFVASTGAIGTADAQIHATRSSMSAKYYGPRRRTASSSSEQWTYSNAVRIR